MKELQNVDELFLDNVSVHYEVMGDDAVWFSFTHSNGQIDHFNIVRKGKKLSTLYSCNTGNMKGPGVEEPTITLKQGLKRSRTPDELAQDPTKTPQDAL